MQLDENSFDIFVKTEKNKLLCNIVLKECIEERVDYAFYLLHDKKRIDTKYYTPKDSADFNLNCDGRYSVVGFVRCGEGNAIKTSREVEFDFDENFVDELEVKMSNPVHISIFGSCVSRDVLQFDSEERLKLETYVARQSIISALATPISINYDDFSTISNFKKNALYNDFTKKAFDFYKNDSSKYLIIDFIDERFCLAKYKGSVVTVSNELKEDKIFSNNTEMFEIGAVSKIKNWKIFKLRKSFLGFSYIYDGILLDEYLKKFCEKILEINSGENIILHRAVMCDNYIDRNGKKNKFPNNHIVNNKKINNRLNYMYDFLQENIEGIKVIDFCNEFYAHESHKWGLAPMHYEDGYYRKMVSKIYQIVKK